MSLKPSSKEIKNSINNINIIIKNLEQRGITSPKAKEDYFWKNHGDLMNRFPFLVTQLCSGGDMSMLNIMIQELEKIEKGQVSTDDADKEIGQKLVDDYINN
jgi:hypothetical protein